MKRLLYLVMLALIVVMVTSVGCGLAPAGTEEQKPGQEPEPKQEPGMEIRLAPIHEVKVTITESTPPEVFVYIQGGLSDSATTFHDLTTLRSGNVISITVTTRRPKGVVAAQVYGYFEKKVSLGTDFLPNLTYTVKVNNKTTTFVIPKK